jgi:hypothetical protein
LIRCFASVLVPAGGEEFVAGSRVPDSKIDRKYVGWQVLVWSVGAWAFALLFALLAGRHGGFLKSLQLSTLLTAVGVLAADALGIAGGGMMPVGRLANWLSYRPPTSGTKVGDTSPNGLAGMGIALIVAPQLLFVGFFVLGNVQ